MGSTHLPYPTPTTLFTYPPIQLPRVINVSCSQYSRAHLGLETLFKERSVFNPVSEYARWVKFFVKFHQRSNYFPNCFLNKIQNDKKNIFQK